MVSNPTNTLMNMNILSSIMDIPDDVLITFIENNNIPTKLIWATSFAKSNGYLTKFAVLLNSKQHLSSSLQTPEWIKYINNVIKPRISKLESPFPEEVLNRKHLYEKKFQITDDIDQVSSKKDTCKNECKDVADDFEKEFSECFDETRYDFTWYGPYERKNVDLIEDNVDDNDDDDNYFYDFTKEQIRFPIKK